jgi:hypothetical protein
MFERPGQQALIVRAPRDDWEVLSIYIDVLQAYIVDLPACLSVVETDLQKRFDIAEGRLSFKSDLAPDVPFRKEDADYYFSDIVSRSWLEARRLFESIHRLTAELRTRG